MEYQGIGIKFIFLCWIQNLKVAHTPISSPQNLALLALHYQDQEAMIPTNDSTITIVYDVSRLKQHPSPIDHNVGQLHLNKEPRLAEVMMNHIRTLLIYLRVGVSICSSACSSFQCSHSIMGQILFSPHQEHK